MDQLGLHGESRLQSHGHLSNNIFMLAILVSMLDVPKDINLCSLDGQALHGLDGKQLWLKEHDVAVIVSSDAMKVPPFFEGLDDSQHFLVMDLIIALYCIQALGVEGHQMPLPIIPGLLQ
ncbi:hypothetical protein C0993_012401 [Termitomyces sp. T159_Od127]|nr:hypothetical protein C0993_012401 [Termitomyces sp. T159_Od127]